MKPYYDAGGITIYHGDCREVLPIKADVLVTDPPYGVGLGVAKDMRAAGHGLAKGMYTSYEDTYAEFKLSVVPGIRAALARLCALRGELHAVHTPEEQRVR